MSPEIVKSGMDGKPPVAIDERDANADSVKATQVKETLRYLDKVVKTLSLFGPGHMNPERAKEEFMIKLNEYLKSYGSLVLDLDGSRVLSDGVLILEEEQQKEAFGFRLFQDGVNQIRIDSGVTKDEIQSLLTILLANFSSGQYAHDDSVTLLWELRPEHIHFSISEGYDESMGDPENAPAATDEYRQVRMALNERRIEYGSPAPGVSPSEEQGKIARFHELISKGGGLYFSPQDRTKLLEESRRGQANLLEKYIEILYRLAGSESDDEHLKRILAIIGQLFQGMVAGSGLEQASRLVKLIRSFAQRSGDDSGQERIVNLVLGQLSNRELVARLLKPLTPQNRKETIDSERAKEILDFLVLLGDSTIEYILEYLGEIADSGVRAQVCNVVAVLGRQRISLFAEKLNSAKGKSANDLLEILKAIGTPEAGEAMLGAAFNPEPEVRLKVVTYAEKLAPRERMKQVLLGLLTDGNERVRGAVIKRLENAEGSDVVERLKEMVLDNDFAYRDKEEKRRIFAVIGALGGKQTIPFFRECFNQSNPLKRSKADEARALAAYMLGVLGDEESRKELEKRASGKFSGAFMKWACTQALGMLDGSTPTSIKTARTSMPPALETLFAEDSAAEPAASSVSPPPAAQPETRRASEEPVRPSAPSVPNLDGLLAEFIAGEKSGDSGKNE